MVTWFAGEEGLDEYLSDLGFDALSRFQMRGLSIELKIDTSGDHFDMCDVRGLLVKARRRATAQSMLDSWSFVEKGTFGKRMVIDVSSHWCS